MKRTIAAANDSGSWIRLFVLALTALLLLGASLTARAQGSADVDPPDRVARLSELSGQVWLFSPDSNEWVAIARNRPITTGDRIATDNGAHAEVALGSTTLRLDSATELEVVLLDDKVFNVQLHSGSVAARLRNAPSVAEFALDTDEGRFRAQAIGRYRFDRFEQTSDLTVEAGQAVFEGRNSALPLTPGQHAQFWLDASGAPQYNMVEPARDAFAAWNAERDRAEPRPTASVRYVSPEMTGAEDLDRYGQWEQTADYGPIWTPRAVGVGWAPYSAGHWAYVRPWGWTWVDDAPWGFAPFHYGRWVNYRSRWCWVPGTYVARPVYAPALVAWVGGVSIAIGGGGRGAPPVGWFPLAPREVYVPSYHYSQRYVRNINVTHVTNVTQITTIVNNTNGAADRRDFANRKFPHAVTVVPASVVTGRQPVAAEAARFRNDPQARELMADARPVKTMNAPPVAAPPAPAKPPSGRVAVTRPPFEGRAPGFGGRPGQERGQERGQGPGSPPVGAAPQAGTAPQPGGSPQGTPAAAPGTAPARPNTPAIAGRPAQAVPVPGRAEGGQVEGQRPGMGRGEQRPPQPNAPPAPNAQAAPGTPPAANAQAAPGVPARPGAQGASPAAPPQPSADERSRGGRRGTPDESRGRPGGVPPPPVTGGAPAAPPSGRNVEPRAVETPRPPPAARPVEPRAMEQRPAETPRPPPTARPVEPRPAEAPRGQNRPPEPARAHEASRPAPPARVAEPARAAEPARVETPRAAPPARVAPPPPQRHEEKPVKVEKADKPDKVEKGEKQR